MPFNDTSCFRCCPPIRPAGYDHLLYVSSLKREFRENRDRWLSRTDLRDKPVVGFWCWGLGYLNPALGTIGCLLHPEQNQGVDLRMLTGYGAKCARELCYEARQFSLLLEDTKIFWRELARGLGSFYFSSPCSNPLFYLMRWGPFILEAFKSFADRQSWSVTEVVWHFPFLINGYLEPRAWRLPVEIAIRVAVRQIELENIYWDGFFSTVIKRWSEVVCNVAKLSQNGPYVHSLAVKDSLKDFVRFFLGISRMDLFQVLKVEEILRKVVLDVLES